MAMVKDSSDTNTSLNTSIELSTIHVSGSPGCSPGPCAGSLNLPNGDAGSTFSAPPEPIRPVKKAGMPYAIANFLNSIVGAGIIGIPFALKECGLVAGLLLLTWVGYLTSQSVKMIVEMGRQLGIMDYEKLAEKIFGRRGYTTISVFMLILAFGAMVAYCVVIGDIVPEILGIQRTAASRSLSIVLCSGGVMLPLSLLKNMSNLAFTSFISCAADIVLVFIIMFCSPIGETVSEAGGFGAVLGGSIIRPATIFSGLGAMSFAFVCHHSSFIVAESLRDSTSERWATVTNISVGMAYSMCLLMGIFGYLGFLADTQGNILKSFVGVAGGAVLTTGRVMLALTMFFTYPMESFVARHSVVCLIWGEEAAADIQRFRRYTVTVCLYLAALLLSLALPDLGIVLELTGAVSASVLAYILPSSMYLCVHSKELISLLKQIGLYDGYFCCCCIKLTEFSHLEKDDVGARGRGNSEDVDAPVEIGTCVQDPENASFFGRLWFKIMVMRKFWLSLSMFVFGIIAFFVGTITTIMSAVAPAE
ncbi:hypothetical protein TrLO_g6583 [Triparma laevis f. longispina]|uniref:Amino acid transporter transmembrane domain-containing protein n=2 Tax=Triparma laevis TaxID=1534972 RepID=A0A9W7FNZ7_9STRA|nr:hypothetical protein TrLO_g6583 [Triparma laevis f. longispina]